MQTHNHLVHKRTPNHLTKLPHKRTLNHLAKLEFKFHLNFRYRVFFEEGVP